MEDKAAVFAFHYKDKNYAISHSRIWDGKIVKVEEEFFFMYRPEKSSIYQSTAAYNLQNRQIEINNNKWLISDTNCFFDSKTYNFVGEDEDCPPKLKGLDTFWYTWSLTNPGTVILY